MQTSLKLFGLLVSLAILSSCSSAPDSPPPVSSVPTPASTCQSFNKGDPLGEAIGRGDLQIKVPVDRRPNSKRTVILLPVNGASQIFWLYRDASGNWTFAEKQTVALAESGHLDIQPMHRLSPEVYPEIIQIIALSQEQWEHRITIQPILEGTTSRWGNVQTYPIQISVQGLVHPFRGIHMGMSGDGLPDYLNQIIDQLEPGSIYIPQTYLSQIEVIEPTIANSQICPITRSSFSSH